MKLNNSNEAYAAISNAQAKVLYAFGAICKKTSWGRLLGIPLCVADHSLEIAKPIAGIGERIFKGSTNIIAERFYEEAKATTGVKQLAGIIPKIFSCVFLPAKLLFRGLNLNRGLLFGGEKFANSKAANCKQKGSDVLLSKKEKERYSKLEKQEHEDYDYLFGWQSCIFEKQLPQMIATLDPESDILFDEDFVNTINETYFSESPDKVNTSFLSIFNDLYARRKNDIRRNGTNMNPKSFESPLFMLRGAQLNLRNQLRIDQRKRRQEKKFKPINTYARLGFEKTNK